MKLTVNSLERIWARSVSHSMGKTDTDAPKTPILTQVEARISLVLRTGWILLHISVCLGVMVNIIHHW